MRPNLDQYFFEIAKVVSTRATCPRASVGAVLVIEKRILATGYNGSPSGLPHCTDVGCLLEDEHCQRTIHAEVNAIAQAAQFGVAVKGATLYLYSSRGDITPCRECAKVMHAAGVGIRKESVDWRIPIVAGSRRENAIK